MSRFITAIATVAALTTLTSAAYAQTAPSNLKATTDAGAAALQGLEARNFEFRTSPEAVRTDPYMQPRDESLERTATLAPLDDQTDLVLKVQESPIEPGVFPNDELRGYEQVEVLFQLQ